jgi:hypothetical protein
MTSDSAHTLHHSPHQPVLVISDRLEDDPVGLLPCPVPLRNMPAALFNAEEYCRSPLVLLDDRSYTSFSMRHMPHRPGLILVLADPDDDSAYSRAAAVGAEAVLSADRPAHWLRLRLHEATDCRHVDWQALLREGPTGGP